MFKTFKVTGLCYSCAGCSDSAHCQMKALKITTANYCTYLFNDIIIISDIYMIYQAGGLAGWYLVRLSVWTDNHYLSLTLKYILNIYVLKIFCCVLKKYSYFDKISSKVNILKLTYKWTKLQLHHHKCVITNIYVKSFKRNNIIFLFIIINACQCIQRNTLTMLYFINNTRNN